MFGISSLWWKKCSEWLRANESCGCAHVVNESMIGEEEMQNVSCWGSGRLLEDFPELREKAVVDVVNSLEVVDDHLRWRDENPGSFLNRLWYGMTGASARRQQIVDRGVQDILSGMSEWLHALQGARAESDIALARVAERLLETRRGVMKLQARHGELRDEVKALDRRLGIHIESTEKALADLDEEFRQESARVRAGEAVTRAKERWRHKRYDGLPPLLRTVLAANDLYWGHFGAFLRLNGSDGKDADELIGHARDTLGNLVDDLARSEKVGLDIVIVERWLGPLETNILPADWREAVAYLLEGVPREVQPLAASASMRLQGLKHTLPENLPRLIQPSYLGELAVRETVRRIEFEWRTKEGALP